MNLFYFLKELTQINVSKYTFGLTDFLESAPGSFQELFWGSAPLLFDMRTGYIQERVMIRGANMLRYNYIEYYVVVFLIAPCLE